MFTHDHIFNTSLCATALALSAALTCAGQARADSYVPHVLTDNICCEESHTDPRLVRAWGATFDPTGFAWVAAHFNGRAELLDGLGNPQSLSIRLEVPPQFNGGFITGLAFNPSNDFIVANSASTMAPARFLFVTLEGTILGWAPRPAPLPQNSFAPIILNNFARGDYYTGVAVSQTTGGSRLYVADFFNSNIRVFDGSFAPVASAFVDPTLPAGFSPYNVRVLGGRVLVAYALRNGRGDDFVPGAGAGIIDAFGLDGAFQSRLVNGGPLNAPWGMALAPANFGTFANTLLVGNVGDGRINAFDPLTGASRGPLADATGTPIAIDGLHGIEFGNGLPDQAVNTLYFAASPSLVVIGEFGRIDRACPADFDGNGTISVQDLFDFLASFFGGNPRADINGVGGVTVQDIFDFLAAHLSGCP